MTIKISEIKVGNRIRKEQEKNIEFLMKSISMFGLLQPIVIDDKYNLIAGFHRLEACKRLGHEEIEATMFVGDNEQNLHAEIQENIARTSKLSMIEKCKIVYESNALLESIGLKQKRGRKSGESKTYTLDDIGAQIGVKKDTVKEYIRVWGKLSPEARILAEEKQIANIKTLAFIADLPPEKQIDALINLDATKKAASEKANKDGNGEDKQKQSPSKKNIELQAKIKALETEISQLKTLLDVANLDLKNAKSELQKAKKAKHLSVEDFENIKILFKFAAKACHPDRGGKTEDMQKINNIMDKYKAES